MTTAEIFLRTCISTTYCAYYNKQLLGKDTTDELRTLKLLYLYYGLDMYVDIGEDIDKMYCTLPTCKKQ